jgi:hypothetical protein
MSNAFPGWEFLPAGQKRGNLSLRTTGSMPALQGMQFATFDFTPFQTVVYLHLRSAQKSVRAMPAI